MIAFFHATILVVVYDRGCKAMIRGPVHDLRTVPTSPHCVEMRSCLVQSRVPMIHDRCDVACTQQRLPKHVDAVIKMPEGHVVKCTVWFPNAIVVSFGPKTFPQLIEAMQRVTDRESSH